MENYGVHTAREQIAVIAKALDEAIVAHSTPQGYGQHVDSKAALLETSEKYGPQTLSDMIAYHIVASGDGRISGTNTQWANNHVSGIENDSDRYEATHYPSGELTFKLSTHQTIIDSIADKIRGGVLQQRLSGKEEPGNNLLPDDMGLVAGEQYSGEYRIELIQLRDLAADYEDKVSQLEEELRTLQNSGQGSDQLEDGGVLVKAASAMEEAIKKLREKLEEIKRRIISLDKSVASTFKSGGENALHSLKGEFDAVRNGLSAIGNNIAETKRTKFEAVQKDVIRIIQKGDLVTVNQRLATGSIETSDYPKLFAAALGRNDRIGSSMAAELIKAAGDIDVSKLPEPDMSDPDAIDTIAYARMQGFKALDPASVLKNAMISRDFYTVSWLRQREELPRILNAEEAGVLAYTAVKHNYPKTATMLITAHCALYNGRNVINHAMQTALEHCDLKTAKAFIPLGVDVTAFARDVAGKDLIDHTLDKDGRKFMNDLLKHWNDLQDERGEETEQEGFDR